VRHDQAVTAVQAGVVLGASSSLVDDHWDWPIHGLRHPPTSTTSGWFVWTGDLSQDDGFFQPWHQGHLFVVAQRLLTRSTFRRALASLWRPATRTCGWTHRCFTLDASAAVCRACYVPVVDESKGMTLRRVGRLPDQRRSSTRSTSASRTRRASPLSIPGRAKWLAKLGLTA
jgi:hypothetical protein